MVTCRATKPPPTPARLRELFVYDPIAGTLVRSVRAGRIAAGTECLPNTSVGYIQIAVDGAKVLGHRVAWAIAHDAWPQGVIDHVNGNRRDNSLKNLRDCSQAANSQNQRSPRIDNKTGFLGVVRRKGSRSPYKARISVGGRSLSIGVFATAEEAHAAYLDAKRRLHEGNTL